MNNPTMEERREMVFYISNLQANGKNIDYGMGEDIKSIILAQPKAVITREDVDKFSSFLIMEPPETFGLELFRWLQSIDVVDKVGG